MKIIVNDSVFDLSNTTYIGIYLEDKDKENIQNMHSDNRVYALSDESQSNFESWIKNIREKCEQKNSL